MLFKFNFNFFIALFATLSLLVACGDDEETPDLPPIVGTWNYASHDYSWEINGQNFISFLVENMELTEQEARFYQTLIEAQVADELGFEGTSIIFNKDGSFSAREDGVEVESGTYSLKNDDSLLVMTSSEGVQEFDVMELSRNKMVISFSELEQEDLTGDGVRENIGFNLEVSFIK